MFLRLALGMEAAEQATVKMNRIRAMPTGVVVLVSGARSALLRGRCPTGLEHAEGLQAVSQDSVGEEGCEIDSAAP